MTGLSSGGPDVTLAALRRAALGARSGRLAEQMAQRVRLSEEQLETGYVQPGLAEVQYAEALRQLGDLGPAQSYAEEVLGDPDRED